MHTSQWWHQNLWPGSLFHGLYFHGCRSTCEIKEICTQWIFPTIRYVVNILVDKQISTWAEHLLVCEHFVLFVGFFLATVYCKIYSVTPLNWHLSTEDTHNITDNSESPDCPSVGSQWCPLWRGSTVYELAAKEGCVYLGGILVTSSRDGSRLNLLLFPQAPWSLTFWLVFEEIRVLAGVGNF